MYDFVYSHWCFFVISTISNFRCTLIISIIFPCKWQIFCLFYSHIYYINWTWIDFCNEENVDIGYSNLKYDWIESRVLFFGRFVFTKTRGPVTSALIILQYSFLNLYHYDCKNTPCLHNLHFPIVLFNLCIVIIPVIGNCMLTGLKFNISRCLQYWNRF